MEIKIKRTTAILLAVCFLVSVTATAVSAVPIGPTPFPSIASNADNQKFREDHSLAIPAIHIPTIVPLFVDVSTWDPSNRDK
jgi:hypothetical protein